MDVQSHNDYDGEIRFSVVPVHASLLTIIISFSWILQDRFGRRFHDNAMLWCSVLRQYGVGLTFTVDKGDEGDHSSVSVRQTTANQMDAMWRKNTRLTELQELAHINFCGKAKFR